MFRKTLLGLSAFFSPILFANGPTYNFNFYNSEAEQVVPIKPEVPQKTTSTSILENPKSEVRPASSVGVFGGAELIFSSKEADALQGEGVSVGLMRSFNPRLYLKAKFTHSEVEFKYDAIKAGLNANTFHGRYWTYKGKDRKLDLELVYYSELFSKASLGLGFGITGSRGKLKTHPDLRALYRSHGAKGLAELVLKSKSFQLAGSCAFVYGRSKLYAARGYQQFAHNVYTHSSVPEKSSNFSSVVLGVSLAFLL